MMPLGYFADFRSRSTLLISGDEQQLMQLAHAFQQFAIGTNQRFLLGTVHVGGARLHRDLWAELVEARTHALTTPEVGVWSWRRTAEGWTDAAELIEAVAREAAACHQSIDDDGESMVMVSKGEYNDDWWSEHAG